MKRLESIDAWRGLAVILMVINHAGHYLTPANFMPIWAYLAVYLTVTLAAPFFLFLIGVSLALSIKRATENPTQSFGFVYLKYAKRGVVLIGLGLLINLFFYYDEPLWRGRILLTIGLSSIIAYPFYYLASSRLKRLMLLLISLTGLLIFPLAYPAMQALALSQPLFGTIFLSEFPLYPWFFLVLIGLMAGRQYFSQGELPDLIRKRIAVAGAIALSSWLAMSILLNGWQIFDFANDYNLNGYWNPSPLTWLWIFGWLALSLNFFSGIYAGETRSRFLAKCLPTLGRQAIALYFLQFFLIIIVGHKLLKIEIYDIISFALITSFIIYLLCLSRKFSSFASNMICARLKPKARTS